MSKKEEFKMFVKGHPELIKFIKSNEMTWQKFFEIYDIYGSTNEVWDKYFKNISEEIEENQKTDSNFSVSELVDMVKKVDLDSVQKNITNISKALGLVQSLITKDEVSTDTYTPRPLYKKFED
jgi:vacuolar-type H+-ATPase subunit D/Vma8